MIFEASVDLPSPGRAMTRTLGLAIRLPRNQFTWSKQTTVPVSWCRPIGTPSNGSAPGAAHGNNPQIWRVVARHSNGTGRYAGLPPPAPGTPRRPTRRPRRSAGSRGQPGRHRCVRAGAGQQRQIRQRRPRRRARRRTPPPATRTPATAATATRGPPVPPPSPPASAHSGSSAVTVTYSPKLATPAPSASSAAACRALRSAAVSWACATPLRRNCRLIAACTSRSTTVAVSAASTGR